MLHQTEMVLHYVIVYSRTLRYRNNVPKDEIRLGRDWDRTGLFPETGHSSSIPCTLIPTLLVVTYPSSIINRLSWP